MTSISRAAVLFAAILFCLTARAQTGARIYPEDVKLWNGSWTGTLTYLDYRSNKPVTIPSDIDVRWNEEQMQLVVAYTYPKEPQANSVDTIIVSGDGQLFNNNRVVTRKKLGNGSVEITTEMMGKDGNDSKDALIRKTYIIGEESYLNRKEVRFAGEKVWIKRNESVFKRRR
jgi:hypothetical protein